jgi:hypothetical protein
MSDPTYCTDADIVRLDPDAVEKLPAADKALGDGEKFARLRGIVKDEINLNLLSREPRVFPDALRDKTPLKIVEVYGVLGQLNLDAAVRGDLNDPYGTLHRDWRERFMQQLNNVRLNVDGVTMPNYQTCAILRG